MTITQAGAELGGALPLMRQPSLRRPSVHLLRMCAVPEDSHEEEMFPLKGQPREN